MADRMDTVSLALPKWVNEYYEEAHWAVRMKKSALMREVLLGYAKAKIAGLRHRGELTGDVVGAYHRMRPGLRH